MAHRLDLATAGLGTDGVLSWCESFIVHEASDLFRSTSAPYLSDGAIIGTVVGAIRIGPGAVRPVPVGLFPETRLALMMEVPAQRYFPFQSCG
jgi:hypothetical protein